MFYLLSTSLLVIETVVVYLFYHAFRSYWKLKDVPGPFWAKFTNLQRVKWVKTKRSHDIFQTVHKTYGTSVRVGPNMVSIADPAAIPIVYPMRPGFPKVGLSMDDV